MNIKNNNDTNGNGNGCPAPGVNAVRDGKISFTLQPLQVSKYIKLTYGGSNDGMIGIGDPTLCLQYLAGYSAIPRKDPSTDLDINRLKLMDWSQDLSKLICYTRIQVSSSWVGLFAVNPIYFGANEDGVQKPEPINLSDFINEYSYRDLVLSVPGKFLLDTKHVLLWDLTAMAGDPTPGSLSITMYFMKEFNRIYHI